MRNRFFFDGELAPGTVIALDDEERHHARVLRVREGEEIEVFNGIGAAYGGMYTADGIRLTQPVPNRESAIAVHLAMSIIQLDKFELVLQKATELGVASIIPLVTDRCEVRPERYRGKHERWEKIVFEATKQSGRSRIAIVEEPAKFDDIVTRDGTKIIFEAEARTSNFELRTSNFLFIGPEGGFSERELQLATKANCAFEQLGPRRLRAETAAIAATALVILR